ncbi:hypothetical protein GD1_104 [Paraglaciecola Antarctic GD virus 1]|nr:hypothetical protein GD1_104 [Paraglaciecola Antarctic GD virus 1]
MFTKVDNTVIQTVNDPNLEGLRGVEGVTHITTGTKFNSFDVYYMGALRLEIRGTLNHDPDREQLVFDESIDGINLLVIGTYNYGREIEFSGYTHYSTGLGLIIPRKDNSNFDSPTFDVLSGAFLNWFGGTINMGNTTYYRQGSNIDIRDGVVNIQNTAQGNLIRSFTTNLKVDGLTKIGGAVILYVAPTKFERFKPIHSDLRPQPSSRRDYALLFYGVQQDTSLSDNPPIIIRNYAGFGNPSDIGYIDNGNGSIINPLAGTETTTNGWVFGSRSDTYILFIKEVEFNFKDLVGDVINPKVYTIDNRNNYRKNQNNRNDLASKVYNKTAVGGKVEFDVIIGIQNAVNSQTQPLDVRFSNDLAAFRFIMYEKGLAETIVNLKGNGVVNTDWTLFSDRSITESDISVVNSYSSLDDSFKFYDFAKAYLFNNFAGESDTIVLRSGILINAGDLNIIIDATADQVFLYNGFTITIKSSRFVDDLLTTGKITFVNGATRGGTTTDEDGTIAPTRQLTISGVIDGAEVRIYDNDASLNSLGTELDGIEINSGTEFAFLHEGVVNEILVQMIASGFEEVLVATTIGAIDQNLKLVPTQDNNE